jgi:hypothetical protein
MADGNAREDDFGSDLQLPWNVLVLLHDSVLSVLPRSRTERTGTRQPHRKNLKTCEGSGARGSDFHSPHHYPILGESPGPVCRATGRRSCNPIFEDVIKMRERYGKFHKSGRHRLISRAKPAKVRDSERTSFSKVSKSNLPAVLMSSYKTQVWVVSGSPQGNRGRKIIYWRDRPDCLFRFRPIN